MDFWATWCPPCRKGIPDLIELKKEFNDQDFEIVGIPDNLLEDLKYGKFISPLKEMNSDVFLGIRDNIPIVLLEKRDDMWKSRKLLYLDK